MKRAIALATGLCLTSIFSFVNCSSTKTIRSKPGTTLVCEVKGNEAVEGFSSARFVADKHNKLTTEFLSTDGKVMAQKKSCRFVEQKHLGGKFAAYCATDPTQQPLLVPYVGVSRIEQKSVKNTQDKVTQFQFNGKKIITTETCYFRSQAPSVKEMPTHLFK